jgi:hypothetical protein
MMKGSEFVPGKFLATIFNVNERTVRKLADKGVLIRCEPGKYALCQSVQGYVEHVRRPPPISWDMALLKDFDAGRGKN